MTTQLYAILDPTLTTIVGWEMADPAVMATLPVVKTQFYRPVNTSTTQPTFNPATQAVVQNGWTITPTDLEPVWQVVALTPAQITTNAAQAAWQTQLSSGLVTAFTTYAATAVPSPAATNAVILQLVKCVSAFLQSQYGVTS